MVLILAEGVTYRIGSTGDEFLLGLKKSVEGVSFFDRMDPAFGAVPGERVSKPPSQVF